MRFLHSFLIHDTSLGLYFNARRAWGTIGCKIACGRIFAAPATYMQEVDYTA